VWQSSVRFFEQHPSLRWRLPLGALALLLLWRRVMRTRRALLRARPASFFQASSLPPYAAQADSLAEPLWPTHLLYSLLRPVKLLQHALLRDSGGFRLLADGGALLGGALAFGWRPGVARAFFGPSGGNNGNSGSNGGSNGRSLGIVYSQPTGSTPLKLDVFNAHRLMRPTAAAAGAAGITANSAADGSGSQQLLSPVILFVHGGAWGSGFRQLYRLLAVQLDLQLGCVVLIPGYRVYPRGRVGQQVDDVTAALAWAREHAAEHGGDPNRVALMGHSSGAHIASMAMLQAVRRIQPEDAASSSSSSSSPSASASVLPASFVGVAGVYDIAQHYEFEAARGVHEVSPMKAACGGEDADPKHFAQVSATLTAAHLTSAQRALLPPTLLLHGLSDHTVPYAQSVRMAYALAGALPLDSRLLDPHTTPRAVPLEPLDSHELYHANAAPTATAVQHQQQPHIGSVQIGDSLTFVPAPFSSSSAGATRLCPLVQLRMCGSARDPALQDHATAMIDLSQPLPENNSSLHPTLPDPQSSQPTHGPGHARWVTEALQTFFDAVAQVKQNQSPRPIVDEVPARAVAIVAQDIAASSPATPLRAHL
jgi:acetyl esterase/lipase